ncbi:hypothetical protein D918_09262 [Trichuris suis]|nr:hypothetical protein D918_09262 [Trichuris suis]
MGNARLLEFSGRVLSSSFSGIFHLVFVCIPMVAVCKGLADCIGCVHKSVMNAVNNRPRTDGCTMKACFLSTLLSAMFLACAISINQPQAFFFTRRLDYFQFFFV